MSVKKSAEIAAGLTEREADPSSSRIHIPDTVNTRACKRQVLKVGELPGEVVAEIEAAEYGVEPR